MEEDDILYQSIIADPEQVSSDVDVSGLRTETDTSPQLLAAVSEFPGLQYDPTQYSSYEDLYNLYSRGLPMAETGTTATTPTQDFTGGQIIDTEGGQDQVTGGLTTDLTTDPINTGAQQDLIDQGIGVQLGQGQPISSPAEGLPQTQEQLDAFNQIPVAPDPAIADAALSGSFYVPNQTGAEIEQPGVLDNISTAARNAFETVKSGASTAVDFISSYGYPAYQALSGNLVAAGASLLNPLTLGLGFAGKVFEGLGDTASKQEYDSYSQEQQSQIDQAYGPSGVMEGYNAVSGFGQGVQATVQSRLDERRSNGIPDTSATSQELIGLQDNLGITDFTQLTQENISDRDDIDPADVGLIDAGSADVQDFADIMPDELPDVTDPIDDFKTSGNVGTSASEVFDTAFGPAPSPDPAIANAALSGSFYVGDSGSDTDTSTGVDAGTADVQDYADIAPEPDPTDRGGGGGGGGSSGGGKIVCTMMNETYGFGSFRNKIWQKYAKDNLTREHEKGYHKIFLPLVKLSKTNIIVRKILEHIAVHRTIDIRQESRGKTHILGRVYRKVLEPICYLVGKYGKR